MFSLQPEQFIQIAIVLVTSLTLHEFAHAFVAYKLGDNTAHSQGRVSLNPLKHLDPWGTIIFLFTSFGWGKPVPVNPINFKNPKRDHALTAFAGPLSNLLIAFIVGFFLPSYPQSFLLVAFFQINISLFVFNLIPIPPLDGSQIISFFLNDNQYYKYQLFIQQNSRYIVLAMFLDLVVLPEIINFSVIQFLVTLVQLVIQPIILLGNI